MRSASDDSSIPLSPMTLGDLSSHLVGIVDSPGISVEQRTHALKTLELLSRLEVPNAQGINAHLDYFYRNGVGVNRDLGKADNYQRISEALPDNEKPSSTSVQKVTHARDVTANIVYFLTDCCAQVFPAGFDGLLLFMFSPFLLVTDLARVSYDVLSRDEKKDFKTALEDTLRENEKGHVIINHAFSTIVGVFFLSIYMTIFSELLVLLYCVFSCYKLYKNYQSVIDMDAYVKYLQEEVLAKLVDEEVEVKSKLEGEIDAIQQHDRPLTVGRAVVDSVLVYCLLVGVILLVIPATTPIGAIMMTLCVALQATVAIGVWLKKRHTDPFPGAFTKFFMETRAKIFPSETMRYNKIQPS